MEAALLEVALLEPVAALVLGVGGGTSRVQPNKAHNQISLMARRPKGRGCGKVDASLIRSPLITRVQSEVANLDNGDWFRLVPRLLFPIHFFRCTAQTAVLKVAGDAPIVTVASPRRARYDRVLIVQACIIVHQNHRTAKESSMSQSENAPPVSKSASKNLPSGIANGIIGFVVGAGVSFLGLQFYGPREKVEFSPPPAEMGMPTVPAGGPQGGGVSAAKGDLTAFVAALEMLSRENPNLKIEFDEAQSATIAAELAKLEAAASLTDAEARSSLQALEAVLTPPQKEIVDSLAIGEVGAPGGQNPFTQEKFKKRLDALLARLDPAAKEARQSSGE